jgi:hypothetical protein
LVAVLTVLSTLTFAFWLPEQRNIKDRLGQPVPKHFTLSFLYTPEDAV